MLTMARPVRSITVLDLVGRLVDSISRDADFRQKLTVHLRQLCKPRSS